MVFLLRITLAAILLCLAVGCTPAAEADIFAASEIQNELIQFIWLELPLDRHAGEVPVRFFVATIDPPRPLVPVITDLPCQVSTPYETVEIRPVEVVVEFDQDNSFEGSYQWYACSRCEDCYMPITYILVLHGRIEESGAEMEVSLIHYGQEAPADILNVHLERVRNPGREPSMTCNGQRQCDRLRYVRRP